MSSSAAGELLDLRLKGLRRPYAVLAHAPELSAAMSGMSPSRWLARQVDLEHWDAVEQLMLAALDVYSGKIAKQCYVAMQGAFGRDSLRVMLLRGMYCEAFGDYASADAIYRAILQKDPTHQMARKRRVCILQAMGSTPQAIQLLVDYLQVFMTDAVAWQQLGELYARVMDFSRASFCYEEVILASPHDHHLHCRIAEVHYSSGTEKSVQAARKHYATSLDICAAGNHRALYGLFMCCLFLRRRCKGGKVDAQLRSLIQWVDEHLTALSSLSSTSATLSSLVLLSSSLLSA